MSVNKYFDNIFILNLKRDEDKRNRIAKHFEQHNITYEFFEACNGYSTEYEREWNFYNERPKLTDYEKRYNKKFLESPGALGYLKSMSEIFKVSLKNKYKRILVFDDDALLHKDFKLKFDQFVNHLPTKYWKIMLLGASQYKWNLTIKNGYYLPQKLKTFGSFATGYDHSVYFELIGECKKLESPFDNIPLGNLYEKYIEQCFVSYPNIVIADVSRSLIRAERNMAEHSEKMKWELDNFLQ
ncbi:MAG TPA: glycosyltransferase family 25 protein [Fulvivirga sp.]|nr:glycosyltransferase family 25 protein [Fulvivirga sp.]